MFQSAARETPKKGSLRESVLLLYCLKREEIEYTRDLALAQIQISKEKGVEAFNDYRKVMFPWVDTAQKREEDTHKKLLEQLVKAGPLSITPMKSASGKIRSRLVQRKEASEKKPNTEEQRKKQNELYKQLGNMIPV